MHNELIRFLHYFFLPVLKTGKFQAELLLDILKVLYRVNRNARDINTNLEVLKRTFGNLHPEEFDTALHDYWNVLKAEADDNLLSKYEDELSDLSKPNDEGAHDE